MTNSSKKFLLDSAGAQSNQINTVFLKKSIVTDNIAESTDLSYRFPYSSPTKTEVDDGKGQLFPELITPDQARFRYKRFQLVKVIINDVAEDTLRNGFKIQKITPGMEENDFDTRFDQEFQRIYRDLLSAGFLKTFKLARLDGRAALYLAYGDKGFAGLEEKPESVRFRSIIKSSIPLSVRDFEVSVSETIPRRVEKIMLSSEVEKGQVINPSRFIYFENESMMGDRLGQSELSPIWDLLTVQKHADWSIGQELWRGASGLIVVTMPPGATGPDATLVLNALDNINAKTRTVIPAGSGVANLASTGSTNVRSSYDILLGQMAASTRIPAFLLSPTKMRINDKGIDSQYAGYLFSIQQSFLTPLLRDCFRRLQETKQLPEGDFNILWTPLDVSPREAATTNYLNVLSEKMSSETKEKQRVEVTKAIEGTPVEIKPPERGTTQG